jgi:hypothetical protein
MNVSGRVKVDLERSGVLLEYECPICGATRFSQWDAEKGLHFQGEFEDWPDVFMMDPIIATYIFVKPAFAQLVINHGWRPVTLSPVEDLEPFTMGHLDEPD